MRKLHMKTTTIYDDNFAIVLTIKLIDFFRCDGKIPQQK